MIDIAQAREHIASKIDEAEIETDPSPHILISDFFPADVYEKIHRYNLFKEVTGEEWISASKSKERRQDTPYHLRKQVDLRKPIDASPDAVAFWKGLERLFYEDDWFGKLVQKKYPQYFDIRFGTVASSGDLFSKLRSMFVLQRHDEGYSLGPHTDSPNRVFTCVFALPDTGGAEEYGTQFVRPKDPAVRCSGDLHHDPAGFDLVKTAPYAPNKFVLFFKTNSSFHAVRHIDRPVPNDRYGMQLGFYEPKGGIFQDLSERGLMEDRTRKPLFDFKVLGRRVQVHRN